MLVVVLGIGVWVGVGVAKHVEWDSRTQKRASGGAQKSLRKTYMTFLNKAAGDDMIELSSHSDMKTLNKHYIDPKIVTKGAGIKFFK